MTDEAYTNTFRGHVLLAAALKDSVEMQGKVASGCSRLLRQRRGHGRSGGPPGYRREFGVSAISGVERLGQCPELVAEVRGYRRRVSAGVRGVSADLIWWTSSRERCAA